MINKGLRRRKLFSINPFLDEKYKVDTTNLIIKLSKTSVELMYYLLSNKLFLSDKFVFNIADFKKFSNKKSDALVTKALGELCSLHIIAKTTMFRVYWVNKKVFLDDKEMEFLENCFNTRRNI